MVPCPSCYVQPSARIRDAALDMLATLEAISKEWHAVGSLSISAVELLDATVAKARGETA